MRDQELADVRTWFEHYAAGFAGNGGCLDPALQIKADHSERVAAEARDLARDLGWTVPRQNAAEALGLLHDIGRFSQFAEYGTFSDSLSVDHGERGWSVAAGSPLWSALDGEEREQILDGIRYHNRRAIPTDVSPGSLPFLELVRDADKLDIFGVVLDAVEEDGFRALPEMLPGITLNRSPSPEVFDEISCRRNVSLGSVKTLADLLLMLLSWAYDLNGRPAIQRFHERGVLLRILSHLDGDIRLRAFAEEVHQHVLHRMGGRAQGKLVECDFRQETKGTAG